MRDFARSFPSCPAMKPCSARSTLMVLWGCCYSSPYWAVKRVLEPMLWMPLLFQSPATDARPRWCGNGLPGARTATATGSLASSFMRSATREVNCSAYVADVTQAEALLSQLRGLVVADGAYISTPLREKLWELGLLLLIPLRKNMKGLASLEQTQHFSGRSIIETEFSVLKDRLGLVTSLPRSLDGYLSHYVLVLLAYQLGR